MKNKWKKYKKNRCYNNFVLKDVLQKSDKSTTNKIKLDITLQ